MITYGEIYNYLLAHPKRAKVLPEWSDDQVAAQVAEMAADQLSLVILDGETIVGGAFGIRRGDAIHIWALFADRPGVFAQILRGWRGLHRNIPFTGTRGGSTISLEAIRGRSERSERSPAKRGPRAERSGARAEPAEPALLQYRS